MRELDHDRCSELLPPFLAGELEHRQAIAMERHLQGCPDCRRERSALQALATAGPPLTSSERSELHAAIERALPETVDEVPVLASRAAGKGSRRWRSRLAPALGAAALLAAIGVGVVQLGGLGTSSDRAEFGTAGGGGEADQGASSEEPAAAPEAASLEAGPRWIGSLGSVTPDELSRKGARGRELRFVAESFQAVAARTKAQAFTDELVTRAPAGLADSIRACVKQVTELGYTALPAFGARARLEGREVLVLGFAWTPARGALDRFMVWAFAGNTCDPVSYQAGSVVARDR
jgi:hypothetical protein